MRQHVWAALLGKRADALESGMLQGKADIILSICTGMSNPGVWYVIDDPDIGCSYIIMDTSRGIS